MERQAKRRARVPEILERVLGPDGLDLGLAAAVEFVEDVNEQVRKHFKDLVQTT